VLYYSHKVKEKIINNTFCLWATMGSRIVLLATTKKIEEIEAMKEKYKDVYKRLSISKKVVDKEITL